MNSKKEEDTRPDTKLARMVADGVEARLESMLQRPEILATVVEAVASRIALMLVEFREERDTVRMRLGQIEQRIEDHESRLRHLESALRLAGSDTEPPPPPRGLRS